MPISRLLPLGGLIVLMCATACTQRPNGLPYMGGPTNFGEANRQTMAAQIIDPAPTYATLVPETRGDHAAQAVDRYRTDKVKKPISAKVQAFSTSSGDDK